MKHAIGSVLLALCVALAAGPRALAASAPDAVANAAGTAAGEAVDREMLVMLRAAPPHFRPEAIYAPAWQDPMRSGSQRRVALGLARRFDLEVLDGWAMPSLSVDCFVMRAPSDEALQRALTGIVRDPHVESAQPMHRFRVLAHDDPLYRLQPTGAPWHLAEVHRVATGKNVKVAEIDSGVEIDHPDLRGRIALARNFVGDEAPPAESHGTAVAGIIAARADDHVGIAGVAPDASLYALRACRETDGHSPATCTTFSLAKALQFAIETDVQVINLSLGGPDDVLLGRLLDAAVSRNIVVVAAADAHRAGGGFPASHSGVLAVAVEASAALPAGAVLAPGRDMPTTLPGHGWGFVSGASYAAAAVSGLAALLRQRAPQYDVRQVRDALAPRRAGRSPVSVDPCEALAGTLDGCDCGCTVGVAEPLVTGH